MILKQDKNMEINDLDAHYFYPGVWGIVVMEIEPVLYIMSFKLKLIYIRKY